MVGLLCSELRDVSLVEVQDILVKSLEVIRESASLSTHCCYQRLKDWLCLCLVEVLNSLVVGSMCLFPIERLCPLKGVHC